MGTDTGIVGVGVKILVVGGMVDGKDSAVGSGEVDSRVGVKGNSCSTNSTWREWYRR